MLLPLKRDAFTNVYIVLELCSGDLFGAIHKGDAPLDPVAVQRYSFQMLTYALLSRLFLLLFVLLLHVAISFLLSMPLLTWGYVGRVRTEACMRFIEPGCCIGI